MCKNKYTYENTAVYKEVNCQKKTFIKWHLKGLTKYGIVQTRREHCSLLNLCQKFLLKNTKQVFTKRLYDDIICKVAEKIKATCLKRCSQKHFKKQLKKR